MMGRAIFALGQAPERTDLKPVCLWVSGMTLGGRKTCPAPDTGRCNRISAHNPTQTGGIHGISSPGIPEHEEIVVHLKAGGNIYPKRTGHAVLTSGAGHFHQRMPGIADPPDDTLLLCSQTSRIRGLCSPAVLIHLCKIIHPRQDQSVISG